MGWGKTSLYGCVLLLGFCTAAFADTPVHSMPSEKLGKVSFPVSCASAVQERFNRAVAILHSFWYEQAEQAFSEIAADDPACAMAHWGIAMSSYHQLWEPVVPAGKLERAQAEIRKAQSLAVKTDRERGFISALAAFFQDANRVEQRTRLIAYERGMEQVYRNNPQDHEAALFYALSLIATAQPSDKTYANQKKAGAIIEPIYREEPNHPGAAHYLIHAYDSPPLAAGALAAARSYAGIAPSVPHALHMPSHIFVRLGLWQEVINSNIAAEAACNSDTAHSDQKMALGERFHAMDYLIYGYLQSGRYGEARGVLEERNAQLKLVNQPKMEYPAAAIPARYAVERHQWAEAADLEPVPTQYRPAYQAIIYWARAMGGARTGKVDRVWQDVAKLDELYKAQLPTDPYWAEQVKIQYLEASAWANHAAGKDEEAIRQARAAADLEEVTEKRPVTPGPVVPAREVLGDLLVEIGQPAAALAEYEKGLRSSPNRFNGLYGAARAADKAGEKQKAAAYYSKLLEICAAAAQSGPELQQAAAYLKMAVASPAPN